MVYSNEDVKWPLVSLKKTGHVSSYSEQTIAMHQTENMKCMEYEQTFRWQAKLEHRSNESVQIIVKIFSSCNVEIFSIDENMCIQFGFLLYQLKPNIYECNSKNMSVRDLLYYQLGSIDLNGTAKVFPHKNIFLSCTP